MARDRRGLLRCETGSVWRHQRLHIGAEGLQAAGAG
jgi:hypothetical protein